MAARGVLVVMEETAHAPPESNHEVGTAATAEAFEALFRAVYPRLVGALAVASDPEAAADAVQDAFVQANLHWGRIAYYESPAAWVRRVAVNRLSNQRRGLQRRDAAIARLAVPVAAELAPADFDLAEAVSALPDRQRLSICLYYLADLAVADVADALGVSEGTVKSNLHDARRALAEKLGARDG